MNITEVKVKLVESPKDRLKAFCSITIDDMFVVRDLKVIDGPKGAFIAMPSRKLTDRCPKCRGKNRLTARFCNECGAKLHKYDSEVGGRRRIKLHADIAHPVTGQCRDIIQERVLEAYEEELERSKEPGYAPQEIYDASELYTETRPDIDAVAYTKDKSDDQESQVAQEHEWKDSHTYDERDEVQTSKDDDEADDEADDSSDDDDAFGAGIL